MELAGNIPQARATARNIARVRVSYVDLEARECKSAIEVWTLLDVYTFDRLDPERDLFEQSVENCHKYYNISAFVTVDKMLEVF